MHKPCNTQRIVAHVLDILELSMDLDTDQLLEVVQQAHECSIHQVDEPPEQFEIPRQALRMFWQFRCHLEAASLDIPRKADR